MAADFEFSFASGNDRATRRSEEAPFRILLLADLTGDPSDRELAERPLLRIDIDNFEQQLQRVAPQLTLAGTTEALSFTSLADFHPDQLYQRLPVFAALRDLRARLQDPARAAAAIAELSGPQPAAPPPAADTASGSPLEQLLGGRPVPSRKTLPGGLDRLLATVVEPHLVKTGDVQPYLQALDQALAEQLRGVLQQPAFQALEAGWRGLSWLLAQLPDEPTLQTFVLPVSQSELNDDLLAAGRPLDQSVFYRRLVTAGSAAPDHAPWSLIAGLYNFTAEAESIRLLAALASITVAAGATLLAGADPSLAGCASSADLADPDRWQPPAADVESRWQALRRSVVGSRIGLLLPRLLLRLPYGRQGEPIDSFSFEELPHGPEADRLLWGHPALAATLALAQGFLAAGWDLAADEPFELDDIPAYHYRVEGESRLQPGAEVLLSERAAQALAQRGLTPLLSYRNRNAVRLPGCLAIAGNALEGPWA